MIAPANPEPEFSPDETGGGGNILSRADNIRSDAKMIRRAIVNGWVIEDSDRREILAKVKETFDKTDKPEHIIGLARVFIDADKVNVAREKSQEPAEPIQHEHRIVVDARISRISAICAAALERIGSGGDSGPDGADRSEHS